MSSYCRSGKRIYRNPERARDKAKHNRKHHGPGNFYQCTFCGFWHLSTRPSLESLGEAVVSGEARLVRQLGEGKALYEWADRFFIYVSSDGDVALIE